MTKVSVSTQNHVVADWENVNESQATGADVGIWKYERLDPGQYDVEAAASQ